MQAQLFTSNPNVPIGPAIMTVTDDLAVAGLAGDGVLGTDVALNEVCVTINHTWAQDIDAVLITPEGTRIAIFADDGGTNGFNGGNTLCLSDLGGAPVENWNASDPALNNPWIPDNALNPLCDGTGGAADTANGTWTMELSDDFFSTFIGNGGTWQSWSLEFVALTCMLDGIDNVQVNAPVGQCEDIAVTVPVPTQMGNCNPLPITTDFSNEEPLNFVGNGMVVTPNTVPMTGYTPGSACADVEIEFVVNGDFGGTFEDVNIRLPDGTLTGNLNVNNTGDCLEKTFVITRTGAQVDAWVAGFGPDLLFELQADAAVNPICAPDQYFRVTLGVPTDCSAFFFNSYNNTGDASGTYPIGTTCFNWCAQDASGFDIVAQQCVTVLPSFNECFDRTLHAGPGECEVVLVYDSALSCPVGSDIDLFLFDTNAPSVNSVRCVIPNTTYGNLYDNPAGYNVTGIRFKVSQFYTGGSTAAFRLYQLINPNGAPTCANRILLDEITGFAVPGAPNNTYITIPLTATNLPAGQIYFEYEGDQGGFFPVGMASVAGGMITFFGSYGNTAGCGDPCNPNTVVPTTPFALDMLAYVQGFTEVTVDIDGPRPWDYIPIGEDSVCMSATFPDGSVVECCFAILVEEYPNNITALACNDNIQLSLDETCGATVGADLVLEGGPYGCYDDYIVTVENPNTGQIMDADPLTPGTQLNFNHINQCFKVTVTDPETGNSCWGEICVEDKLPPVIVACPNDTVMCEADTEPLCAGGSVPCPTVTDACDPFVSATWVDWVTDGSCATGLERTIQRRWTFTDDSGNSASCDQIIVVELSTLFDVALPGNYDDLANPALLCEEKIDRNKNVFAHVLDFPFCVDGYLLDSAIWLATGGDPTIMNPDARDLSGTRLPRTLGWNCLDQGPYEGHPSPFGVYYEPHPQWELFGVCWGPNQIEQWAGTGFPTGAGCSNIIAEYRDTRINLYDPECDAGDVGCYKVLRQWTLIDWCTGEVGGHNQIIKVLDKEGPTVLAPDVIDVGTDPWNCTGRFDVPAPWIVDNCSNDVDYTVITKFGTVLGNSEQGYIVVDIPIGQYPLYIEAYDCCGNVTVDSVIMDVRDNTPPVCISEDRLQLSLAGSQSPGTNYAAICADDLDKASYDNCSPTVWFKMIRMEELLGTVNGSFADNTVACGGVNGDDDAIIQGNQVYFDDCAKFCCEDADEIRMVVLRVHDVNPGAGPVNPLAYTPPAGALVGHFTDCWVEIDVRDKAQPIVVAPPDIVVSCMFWFDDSEDALSDIDNPTFGRVVTDLADRQKVKTIDIVCEEWCNDHPKYDYEPSRNRPAIWRQACDFYDLYYNDAHPDDKYELVWGFDGYVVRTCGATPTIRVDDRRECGQGVINRDVIVSFQDPKTGGVVTFRDRQEIWVIDCDPFYATEDCFDDDDCIDWPLFCQQPDPLDGCGADLDPYTNPQLGFPQIVNGCDDNCALVAVEYEDEVFTVEPDACFKVIRTWTVIDWCTYDPLAPEVADGDNPDIISEGRYQFIQIIKVRDQIDPVLTVDVGDCEPAVKNPIDEICYGHIEICAEATDDCSPDDWISYDYKVDINSDGVGHFGTFDYYVGKLTRRQFDNGTVLDKDSLRCVNYIQDSYCNPYADDPTQPFCASGTYPVGTHTFYFFAEDGCGNVIKETVVVEILDCKEPTPYCKTGIISVVMPVNGEICIWAIDLNDGSFDNCTNQEDLKFYFNGDPNWVEYCINCDTFEARGADDKVLIDVEVWVEDEEGNTDFCITTIEIQDNQDVCDDSGSLTGQVQNAMMKDMVEHVEMTLNGGMRTDITSADGFYSFKDLQFTNDFSVKAYRNDEPLNGVSTKDLVAIQRHLLGLTAFTSGYQMIAADVNNNDAVTAADISALRKVILGSEADFSRWNGQTSWRFSDGTVDLSNNLSPWGFTEELSYKDVTSSMRGVDFDATKIGDVTGDAHSNGLIDNSTRSNDKLIFTVADADIVAGDVYEMAVTAENFDAISGYQFTMKYDVNALSFTGIESGSLTVSEGNLGVNGISEGVITMSWNNASGQATTVADGEVLFTVTFDAGTNTKASNAIRVNSEITRAEAYGADLEDKGLTIEFRNGADAVEVFELYQNTPNPFNATTVVSYTLPRAMKAVISVYDVAGKVVLVKEVSGNKGYNEIELSKAQLNGAGVLYYQLDAADFTATKRMVLID